MLVLLYAISSKDTIGIKYISRDFTETPTIYTSGNECIAINKNGKDGMLYTTMCKDEMLLLKEVSSELVSCDGKSYNILSGGLIICKEMLGKGICNTAVITNTVDQDTNKTTILLYNDSMAVTVVYPANDTEYIIRVYTPLVCN
jgi:hypothetical protein